MSKKYTKEEIKEKLRDMANADESYAQMSQESEVFSPEEATGKAISELTSTKNVEALSHFSDTEIKQLAIMNAIADIYDVDIMKTFIQKFGSLRISLNRKGRSEIVDITKEKRNAGLFPNFADRMSRI